MNTEKQTTAMHELIAFIDEELKMHDFSQLPAREKAMELLAKEREQIEQAFVKGFGSNLFDVSENSSSASEYFTKTFK